MKKVFYIFRHGQTDYNATRRVQSFLDIPLNQQGIDQAKELAKILSNIQFDCIYSSPLSRALDTAKIVSENRNIEIVKDEGLKERNLGILCGKLVNMTNDPADTPFDVNTDIVNIPSALLFNNDYTPENGESDTMFGKRVRETMIEIAKSTKGNTIGISTHGGVIGSLIRQFTGFSNGGTPNTGYITMQWDGKTFSLQETPDWLLKANNINQSR